jgi:outer membrane protein
VGGSTASAGLSTGSGNGNGANGGGASIQQVGAITPNLDPVLQNTTVLSHLTQPQANTILSQTAALVISQRTYSTVLTEGLLSGGQVQASMYEQHFRENSPSDVLNPVSAPRMDLYIQHNFLQGFGIKLNDRGIRIAKRNTVAAQETFRLQMLDLVANVLNLYWDLVSANDELKARQSALEMAQKFEADTKKEVELGTQARVELPRAGAEVASRKQDALIAQAGVGRQAALLKDALSRSEDPLLESAEIVPTDRVQVPDSDDLPPLRELVARAMAKRPDVAVSKIRDENAAMNAAGTANPLLPTLRGGFRTYDRGVAGVPQTSSGVAPNPYFVGGFSNGFGQVVRRNFPNNVGSIFISMPFENRQSQGDYGIDQLQLAQSQLSGQRDTNKIVVDISNYVSAVRQTRARYSAAVNTRKLQEELLTAEQKKFSFGASTINDLIVDQRTLAAAQISEVTALTNYAHARVSLDQVLGESLEVNHVSFEEGLKGEVKRESKAPGGN